MQVKIQKQKGSISGEEYWAIAIYGVPIMVEHFDNKPIILCMSDAQYGYLKHYNIDIEEFLTNIIKDEDELSCM